MKSPDPGRSLAAPLDDLHSNERAKYDSHFLRGTLQASLADVATGAVDETDTLLAKFFGIYQQDDRDLREERRRAKLEPRYQFMVRVRLPGGVCTPQQWLALDSLARQYGGDTLRLTTRQTFQFHGIRKKHLRTLIDGLRKAGLDTIAACGDDNRNVICTANPLLSSVHAEASALARALSEHLRPQTAAYREIFLGEEARKESANEEPLYGRTYLPRKFKIAVAIPPRNDVDVHAHDLGFIAIVENGAIAGYNVLVGGGMGMTHRQPATFPRLSDVIGFCRKSDVLAVAEHTLRIQRDFGDRKDRLHARFKYTIEDLGIEWFVAELSRRMGKPLQPARDFAFATTGDAVGWHRGADGRWHCTLFVDNGRLADFPGKALMSGLREIAASFGGIFSLTTNQNVVLAGMTDDERTVIEGLLRKHGLGEPEALARHAMACVAFPTCGLAMAESERYMPKFLDRLQTVFRDAGIPDVPVNIRMSGCPNGCSRPYLGEIALVGKAPGRYNLYLGASPRGDRLNTLYRENADERQILESLQPVIRRYATERTAGEAFGDFAVRAGIVPAKLHGRDFQK